MLALDSASRSKRQSFFSRRLGWLYTQLTDLRADPSIKKVILVPWAEYDIMKYRYEKKILEKTGPVHLAVAQLDQKVRTLLLSL